jgi:hypothetical protein
MIWVTNYGLRLARRCAASSSPLRSADVPSCSVSILIAPLTTGKNLNEVHALVRYVALKRNDASREAPPSS